MNAAVGSRVPTILRLLVGADGRARLRMEGVSMLPMLSEGMVLEVSGFREEDARVGEVVIFPQQGQLVAHRIVGFTPDGVQTSGDNRPHCVERVAFDEILAQVTAVYDRDGPDAKRVDDEAYRRRAKRYARSRRIRAIPSQAAALKRRIHNALPWRRGRSFEALWGALQGYLCDDTALVERSLARVDVEGLASCANRHSCAALLQQAVRRATPRAPLLLLNDRLQEIVRFDGMRSFFLPVQIAATVAILRESGIPFALLKGTAFAYGQLPEMKLFPSHDIDILVPRSAVDDAVKALQDRGYYFTADAATRKNYAHTHHHIAPLFPPGMKGWYVELHTQLAPPGTVSTRTDWEALRGYLSTVKGAAGEAPTLDRFAATLHYAIHGLRFDRFRDAVACARGLASLDERERERLRAVTSDESIEPIRLAAFLSVAAGLAAIPWPPPSRRVQAYLRWIRRREAMPRLLRERAEFMDGWFAGGLRGVTNELRRFAEVPERLALRIIVALATMMYVPLMRL